MKTFLIAQGAPWVPPEVDQFGGVRVAPWETEPSTTVLVLIFSVLGIVCAVLLYFAVRLIRSGRGGILRRLLLVSYGIASFGLACSYGNGSLDDWPEPLSYWIGATILWLCLHYAIPPSRK